jgi:hypothetical protein
MEGRQEETFEEMPTLTMLFVDEGQRWFRTRLSSRTSSMLMMGRVQLSNDWSPIDLL